MELKKSPEAKLLDTVEEDDFSLDSNSSVSNSENELRVKTDSNPVTKRKTNEFVS